MFSSLFIFSIDQRQKVGETVRERLKRLYGDHTSYPYKTTARQLLYNNIDCVGNQIYLEYSSSTYPWSCGGTSIPSVTEVNAEHTIPQSLFDSNLPMVSDFHHLYASPAKINNARSNYPFAQFDYSQCGKWCKGTSCQNSAPSGSYEEWDCVSDDGNSFMPRTADRGRIARAVFYFYTMYPQYSISDVGSVSLFKQWNSQYQPDSREIARNDAINQTQHNRNPYIDDPSLVDQAW